MGAWLYLTEYPPTLKCHHNPVGRSHAPHWFLYVYRCIPSPCALPLGCRVLPRPPWAPPRPHPNLSHPRGACRSCCYIAASARLGADHNAESLGALSPHSSILRSVLAGSRATDCRTTPFVMVLTLSHDYPDAATQHLALELAQYAPHDPLHHIPRTDKACQLNPGLGLDTRLFDPLGRMGPARQRPDQTRQF